jgi:hypothetical protein
VYIFPCEYWHTTIVAFRRSRKTPYIASEMPDPAVIPEQVQRVHTFDVSFEHLIFGKAGEILLCGVLSAEAVKSLNGLRNRLICEIPHQWDGGEMLRLRKNTDPPKHRLAFHVTIGNLLGSFTHGRLKALQQTPWMPQPLKTQVDVLRLLHYRQRNCFKLDREPAEHFPLLRPKSP